MPNRRAVTRGGAMEAAILENLRQGHSIRAACAAAGCAERTYHRFAMASPAHRHDREVAQQEAERRLVGVVLDSVAGGDVGSAKWLLERRWPHVYGLLQRLEATVDADHRVDVEVLALAERFSNLDDAQVAGELSRLAWVTEQPTIPTSPATDEAPIILGSEGGSPATPAAQQAGLIMGGEVPPSGRGTARTLPTQQPAATDSTADTPENGAGVLNHTNAIEQAPLRQVVMPPPSSCPHCRGHVPGRHESQCPAFEVDGRLKAPLTPFAIGGDPR